MTSTFKKLLSAAMALVLVLSMVPAVSATETEATETEQTQPTRGAALGASKTYEADEWIEVSTVAELKAALGNGSGASAEANEGKVMGVRLLNDITITKELDDNKTGGTMLYIGYILENDDDTVTTRDQDVVLDLNGFTLATDETVKRSRLFGTYGNSTFVITNGTIDMDGTFTGYSSFCFLHKKNALTLDGVSVAQKDESDRTNYGGLLHNAVTGTTITIINSDIAKEGGSVYRGGIINTGNNGIVITATNSTFTGGKVVGGTYSTTVYHARGGQIYIASGSTLNATNCSFVGGVSENSDPETYNSAGGNIYGYGTAKLNLTDCYVSGGTASYGGNIGIQGATLTLDGTTVSGGQATLRGGNIYANSSSTYKATAVTITDSTVENGSVTNTENVVVYGGNICMDGGEDKYGCKLTVNSGTISGGQVSAASTASSTYIGGGNIYGTGAAAITLNGGTIADGSIYNNGADGSTNALAAGGNIYVTVSSTLLVYDGVTIRDGEADAKNVSGVHARGGNLAYSGSTVRLYGGLITGGTAERAGNLFSPTTSSKLYIYEGCTIENGNATRSYGGNMSFNGSVYMYGGTIKGGTGYSSNGKDVYVASHASAKFYMYGGSVLGTSNALFKGSLGTMELYSGEFGANPDDAYVAACSTESEANGKYYVIHNDVEGSTTVVEATCTTAGTKTIECLECGPNSTTARVYTYAIPATGHTEEVVPGKAATCTETGLTEGVKCSVCDAVLTAQETIASTGHAWDEGVVTTDPTCNGEGVKTYTCGTCGETKTEVVSATGHTPVTDEAVAPDCTNTGLTEGIHCDVCGEVIVAQEEIAALGHSYSGVYTEPTYEADGYTTYTCSVCGDSYVETDEGSQLQRVAPEATVTEQEAMILTPADEYMVWPSGDATINRPLEIVVNFKAEDTLEECLAGGYAQWLVDFNITVEGLENGSVVADNCYLAGNYGSYGWIVIPTDGMVLENGVTYPVVARYDPTLNYKDICKSVKDFTAAIHIDQAILDANPDLQVSLDLVMTNPADAEDKLYVGETIVYTAEKLKNIEVTLPEALVTPMGKVTLEDGGYRVWNGVVSDNESEALEPGVGKLPLEVAVNFKAIDTLEECLAGGYAKWLVDFNITVEGLENGSFVADGCYLAGNYGSYGWIKIPLDGQTISEGVAYPVVALYDPTLNYKDICKSVKDFTAAIHIDQAVLDANPNMTVKLELVMTNPNNANDTMQIGEDLIYSFAQLRNDIVAQNKDTGVLYTDLAVALGEAEDQTVILLSDVTAEESVALNFSVTLDLNGYTLNAVRIGVDNTSHIVDSTNGKGLLTVSGTITLNSGNAAIPVKTTDGYRFTSLEIITRAKNKEDYKIFGAYFVGEVGTDATSMLATQLADGGADNNLTVRVKLTYTSLDGSNSGNAVFNFSDALVQQYAANWATSDFRVNIRGAEKVANLKATLEIVASIDGKEIVLSSDAFELQ